jgi:hypothetical protein
MAVKRAPAKAKAAKPAAAKVMIKLPRSDLSGVQRAAVANDFEEDCGFVFRRKTPRVVEAAPPAKGVQKAVSTPKKPAAKPVVVESVNPTPLKRQALERQRRRSSLPGLGMANGGRRRSSIGIGIGLAHGIQPAWQQCPIA